MIEYDEPKKFKLCLSPLATRPVLYTDTIKGGQQALRDDLWAVTTDELNKVQQDALDAARYRWRKVEDELPPDEVGVLVTDGERVTAAERFMGIWTTHEVSGHDAEVSFDHCVTHWKPLDAPPST